MFSLDEAIPRDLAKAERQRRFADAFEEARRRAAAEGSTWHRGKDRARGWCWGGAGAVAGAGEEPVPGGAAEAAGAGEPVVYGGSASAVPGEVNEALDLMVGG